MVFSSASLFSQCEVSSSPDRGAKLFKYLDASISANTLLPLPSVGSFVGMLFHYAAQTLIRRSLFCLLRGSGPLFGVGDECVESRVAMQGLENAVVLDGESLTGE
jgi:hypothetical protein